GDPAEGRCFRRVPAVELVHAQTQLAGETGVAQTGQGVFQVSLVSEPDSIRLHLVEAHAAFGGPFRQGEQELRVEEGLAAGETEDYDSFANGIFEEAQGHLDIEPIRPLDGDAAVRARQIALIGAGEGEIVGAKGARAASDGPDFTATVGVRWWDGL